MSKGWKEEHRTKQAEAIRRWKPWERSTGPRTEAGKVVSSGNAVTHGMRSQDAAALEVVVADLLAEGRAVLDEIED